MIPRPPNSRWTWTPIIATQKTTIAVPISLRLAAGESIPIASIVGGLIVWVLGGGWGKTVDCELSTGRVGESCQL
jgi:hypothetical protein